MPPDLAMHGRVNIILYVRRLEAIIIDFPGCAIQKEIILILQMEVLKKDFLAYN